jgi:hypothetical protein
MELVRSATYAPVHLGHAEHPPSEASLSDYLNTERARNQPVALMAEASREPRRMANVKLAHYQNHPEQPSF